jgi:UDP-4-amino-4,6-dideoxy-N-acetyl-beta-L-altrosamine transaminase
MNSKIIPYGKQNITQEDIDAVCIALKGDFLTQGPTILEFEKKFSNYIGCKYSIAVANGTAALHLSTLALNLQKGDKVITTPLTFAASANCIRYCQGEVLFADIDPLTYLIDLDKVEQIILSQPFGSVKGIIPVDFAGRAVDMEKVKQLAKKYGLWIIEDACHAPGAYFSDSKNVRHNCGNGEYADLAIFSFHPVKHIATGEGGMITTNDENLYKKLLELRTHGITRNHENFINSINLATGINTETEYPGWYMEMQDLGFNYRFTDFQAALGLSQLKRADAGLMRRREIANKYNKAFKNHNFIKGQSGYFPNHAYHLYVLEVTDRLGLYNYLKKHNIFSQVHYIPCHLMPYYKSLGWKEGDFPFVEEYYKHCLSIPMFPSLNDEDVDFVISTIKKYYV